ncbi:C40 family peptidase [Microbacteriaceae bacterium VKM Ac-2854]|nr:C40 family peptidase [Microbacteriaceae bacterium VKM Ac-2854]
MLNRSWLLEESRLADAPIRTLPRERTWKGRLPMAVGAAFAVTAVTASLGFAPAQADDPQYPSWDDVQNAKSNEATKQAEIDRITGLIAGLQSDADAASLVSMQKAEAARQAQDALDAATTQVESLQAKAKTAAAKADTSRMRAGLLAAHLAKSAGGDLSMNLLVKGDGASDLLYQLGTMAQLTESSQAVYDEALADKNAAESLQKQADVAVAARTTLAAAADDAATEAQAAAAAVRAALAAQQEKSEELVAQLATLKDTTVEVEAAYLAGEQKRQEEEAAAAAAAAAEAAAQAAAAQAAAAAAAAAGSGSSGSGSNSGSGSGSGLGSGTVTVPAAPAPVAPAAPDPVVSVGAPNSSAVETAIAFGMAQLGEPYDSPGNSDSTWDCSGLTKSSYAAAGIYIGTHSATNQYNTAASKGQLVPYSERQRGDLIFWGSGGDYYHVAIYLGNGQILEAPDYGKTVRVWNTWGSPTGMVARVSG